MMPFFILEVVFLPLHLLFLKLLHKHGELTENRFALLAVGYLGAMVFTFSHAISTSPVVKIAGFVLMLLCWFLGYSIARRIYRRIR